MVSDSTGVAGCATTSASDVVPVAGSAGTCVASSAPNKPPSNPPIFSRAVSMSCETGLASALASSTFSAGIACFARYPAAAFCNNLAASASFSALSCSAFCWASISFFFFRCSLAAACSTLAAPSLAVSSFLLRAHPMPCRSRRWSPGLRGGERRGANWRVWKFSVSFRQVVVAVCSYKKKKSKCLDTRSRRTGRRRGDARVYPSLQQWTEIKATMHK